MKLFPDKARAIFAEGGIPLLRGEWAATPVEARGVAQGINRPVRVGALFHGEVKGSQEAASAQEAEEIARKLLGSVVEGMRVDKLWVEERPEIARGVYAYVSLDRWEEKPFILLNGQNVENIYSSKYLLEAGVPFRHFSISEGLPTFEARFLAKALGFRGRAIAAVGDILVNLARIWLRYDAEYVTLNPLVETKDSRLAAASAELWVDDDALFRHPELKAQEEMLLLRTEKERKAEESGTPWVELDGDIGMFVAGSGMGMTANDVLALAGGKPANFSDVGGGPSPERVASAFELLFTDAAVKGIVAYYFGGISRCDDFATGLTMAIGKQTPKIPIVVKMAGTREKEGRDILAAAVKGNPELYACLKFIGGMETSVEELVRELLGFTSRG